MVSILCLSGTVMLYGFLWLHSNQIHVHYFPSSKEQQFYKFYARLKVLLQFFITFIKITISLFVFPLNKLKLVALNMLRVVSIA